MMAPWTTGQERLNSSCTSKVVENVQLCEHLHHLHKNSKSWLCHSQLWHCQDPWERSKRSNFNTAKATKFQPSHNKPMWITLRLGRPWTILITAGSSNICPLPNPRLCHLPPRWSVGVQGRYRALCLGGEGELWCNGGLWSGGVVGEGGGFSNRSRPLLEFSGVSCTSRSMIRTQKQSVDTSLGCFYTRVVWGAPQVRWGMLKKMFTTSFDYIYFHCAFWKVDQTIRTASCSYSSCSDRQRCQKRAPTDTSSLYSRPPTKWGGKNANAASDQLCLIYMPVIEMISPSCCSSFSN